MPHSAHAKFWRFAGLVLAGLSFWLGAGYTVLGNRGANTPSYYLIKDILPGGMRFVGAVLLALGAGLVYVVFERFDTVSKWILRVFAAWGFLVGTSMFGSWYLSGQIVWGAPVVWMGLGMLAQGMVLYPPDLYYRGSPRDAGRSLRGSRR